MVDDALVSDLGTPMTAPFLVRVFYRVSMAVLALASLLLLYVALSAGRTESRVLRFTTPLTVERTFNGNLRLHYGYCKTEAIPARVIYTLVNSHVVVLPPELTNLPDGCKEATQDVVLPASVRPGRYHLDVLVIYDLYPWKQDVTQIRSANTIIIPEPEPRLGLLRRVP